MGQAFFEPGRLATSDRWRDREAEVAALTDERRSLFERLGACESGQRFSQVLGTLRLTRRGEVGSAAVHMLADNPIHHAGKLREVCAIGSSLTIFVSQSFS